VQDNILSFVPRAAAIFIVFAFTFPWMLRIMSGFAAGIIRRLPELVR
jgi:flagellar biosynthesis protein FliQ